jgi:hypothetical protein
MTPIAPERPLAYRLNDLHNHAPWGRSKSYELVASGRLPARKLDGATLVLAEDLEDFIRGLDRVEARVPAAAE